MDDIIPLVVGECREGPVTHDAGIADHAVVSAVLLDVGFKACVAQLAIADIKLDEAPAATQGGDLVKGRLRPLQVAVVVDDYGETVGRQLEGDGAANSLAGAANQYGRAHCFCSSKSVSCASVG